MRLEVVFKAQSLGALALVMVGCAEPRRSALDRGSVGELATTNAQREAPGPLVWGGERKLVASDSAEFDQLGYSVSLAGNRALVGAYGEDSYRGAAYVFVRDDGSWIEEQKLVASDRGENDNFAFSISFAGDRALVGAPSKDSYRGAAYVFVRSGDSWSEEQKLVASDAGDYDQLGWSVSLIEDRALVGAYGKDSTRGAAYVFVRSDTSWTEEQKLVATDGADEDLFGYSVSLTADRALLAAPVDDAARGAAYVFVRSDTSWTEEQKLVASDGAEDDHLGISVSLTADRALLGAYWDETRRGAAYVFALSGGVWTEEQKLVASDGISSHRFGNATSLDTDRALIGAYGSQGGAAYAFVRGGSSWVEEQKLVASDGASNLFGWSVSLAGDRALLGAHYDDNLRGAAYAFAFGLANGEACSGGADCASGHCVDELCCNIDCTGACGACSAAEGADDDGTCTVFPAGSEGSPNCDTLACNGQSPECAPCATDDDCSETRYCASDETCQPRRGRGEACDDREGEDCLLEGCRACEDGVCVDGVCCDTACDGSCEACTAELKGSGDDGECAPIETGADVENECPDDGAALGTRCTSDEECESEHCVDGVCCDASCDEPCEGCTAALKGDGDDGACGYVAAGLNPPVSSSDPTLDCDENDACRDAPSCNGAGRCDCAPRCESDADCREGERCTSDGGCVRESEANGPDDDSGCGCRAVGATGDSPSSWLGATLALLLIRRRFPASKSTRSRTRRVSVSSAPDFSRGAVANDRIGGGQTCLSFRAATGWDDPLSEATWSRDDARAV